MATPVFLAVDNLIYDELFNVEAASIATEKGDAAVVEDTFGFYMKKAESASEEITFIYRCRQVEAQKKTGTGEDIKSGERLYYIVASKKVSPNYSGSAGTDYYFCGWAKKDAGANEASVLMNFDGTRHTEAGR